MDFGLVASIAPLAAFVVLFQDFGLQQAIVQRHEISQDQLSVGFWFTVLLGLVCAGVLLAAATPVSAFFGDSRLVLLTMAMAPSLIIASLGSVSAALLNRRMQFKTLAVIDIAAALSVFLTAVLSAWLGAQYWALILASFAGNSATFVGVWRAARWRPDRPSLRLPDRGMLRFGANLTGFSFVIFLARNLDNVLIGRFVGATALGLYDRAYKLLLFPLYNVSAPVARIAVPLLSRIETDKPRLRKAYLKITLPMALVTIPGMAGLVATADETVRLVFGPGWHQIVPIFAWLGLSGLVQPMTYSVTWLLVAQARSAVMFRWGLYSSATAILSFVIGLHWGAAGVACAYATSDYLLRLPILYLVAGRVGPVTAFDLMCLHGPLLVAAGATSLISGGLLRSRYGLGGPSLIAGTIVVSYGLAVAALALLPRNRAGLRETILLLRQLGRGTRSA
jgi:O-antigen/teichoic acid export membrane protein